MIIAERQLIPNQTFWIRSVKLHPVRTWRKEAMLRLSYRVDGELYAADGKLLNGTLTIDAELNTATGEVGCLIDGLESGTAMVPVAPRNGGAMPKTVKMPDASGQAYNAVMLDTEGYPVPEVDATAVTQPISHWAVERLVPIHTGMGFALTNLNVVPKKHPDTGALITTEDRNTGAVVQWVYVHADPDLVLMTRPRMKASGTGGRSGAAKDGTGARVVQFAD